ncbi:hypothetical protein EJB05_06833, partial [Eragrostis curvula]
MASRQDRREATAEANARRAAEELARARDERVAQAEVDARTAADEIARARADRGSALSGATYHDTAAAADYNRGGGGGILEGAKNFMSAVGRTNQGGPGLFGALGNVTGAIKDKLTMGAGGVQQQQQHHECTWPRALVKWFLMLGVWPVGSARAKAVLIV